MSGNLCTLLLLCTLTLEMELLAYLFAYLFHCITCSFCLFLSHDSFSLIICGVYGLDGGRGAPPSESFELELSCLSVGLAGGKGTPPSESLELE
jgi:hypothetical protein